MKVIVIGQVKFGVGRVASNQSVSSIHFILVGLTSILVKDNIVSSVACELQVALITVCEMPGSIHTISGCVYHNNDCTS